MRIRVMTEKDVSAGLRLNTLCGWNQTAADWLRFLKQSPNGCFVMKQDTNVVGTATTISYQNRFAWIGMVLVDPERRKQGIGTQLLNKTIEYLDQCHISTMKLDATPQGKPLYAKLGFVSEYEIERWIVKRSAADSVSPTSRRTPAGLTRVQLDQICKLDKELFGADRGFLLHSLQDQAPEFTMAVWEQESAQGYCFGRRGLFADHLGPWMSTSRAVAEKLLHAFLTQSSRDTVIVDCFQSNSMTLELLNSCGFTLSRSLTRMVRGPNTHPGRPDSLCAILGPEFG
ncbi:MAG: GNAT family N-acetyltransferase [Candidatus Acidiferrum sp.]